MAVERIFVNNDLQKIADACDGFNNITVTVEESNVIFKDEDNNILFEINQNTTGIASGYAKYTLKVYNDSDNSFSWTNDYNTTQRISYVYKCNNGIMINLYAVNYANNAVTYLFPLYITKTNKGKTAFIFSSQQQSTGDIYNFLYTRLICVAWGDDPTFIYYSFSPASRSISVICPLPTNNIYGEPSYTVNAGFMPFTMNPKMEYGKIVINNEVWLSNGYFAIKD